MKSFYYSKTLSVTDSQQRFELPVLRSVSIKNNGDYDVYVNFEADIDSDSLVIPVGAVEEFEFSPLDIRYKCAASETATIQIYGLTNEKA